MFDCFMVNKIEIKQQILLLVLLFIFLIHVGILIEYSVVSHQRRKKKTIKNVLNQILWTAFKKGDSFEVFSKFETLYFTFV